MNEIITTPDPRLRQKSTRIREISDKTRDIISDMIAASLDWEDEHPHELSAAMAAPQLGINQRIIIIRDDLDDKKNNTFTALINPEIIRTEGKLEEDYEGCLSVPNIYGLVSRPHRVKIKAQLLDGKDIRLKADGFLARTLMHEIDHLEGRLFIDLIRDNPKAFFRLNSEGDLNPVDDYETEIKNNRNLFPEETD